METSFLTFSKNFPEHAAHVVKVILVFGFFHSLSRSPSDGQGV